MKVKYLIFAMLILTALTTSISSASCASAQAQVSITQPESAEGQFDVSIDVADVENLDAGQFDLTYTSSVLKVVNVTDGSFAGTTVPIDNWKALDSDTIRVLFNLPEVEGVSGSGQVSVITFEVVGAIDDIGYLTLSNVLLGNTTAKEIATSLSQTGDGISVVSEFSQPTMIIAVIAVCAIVFVYLYLWRSRDQTKETPSVQERSGNLKRIVQLFRASCLNRVHVKKLFTISIMTCLAILLLPCSITPVSASDEGYCLGIYGNANQDGTINSSDVDSVEAMILGLETSTDLADANFDETLNMLDVTQIELITLGEEEQLTVNMYTTEESSGPVTVVPVTIDMPVTRIVSCSANHIATMRAMQVDISTIVGVREDVHNASSYFSEYADIPSIGTGFPINYEAILALYPEVVIIWTNGYAEDASNLPGVPCIGFDCSNADTYVDEIIRLSYIINRVEEGQELVDFYNDVVNGIQDKLSTVSTEDMPKVYYESKFAYSTTGSGTQGDALLTKAGANNIFSDVTGYIDTDAEAVMVRNPEVIVKFCRRYATYGGYYEGTAVSAMIEARDEIMNRVELTNTNAVQNSKVYVLDGDIVGATRNFIGMAYLAKLFYPDLFADLDPEAIHIEYLTRFQGLPEDFLDTQTGIFVYTG